MGKKKGLAAFVTKRRKKEEAPAPVAAKSNPPPMQDFVDFIVPGFAGFAGTKLTTRVVNGMVLKRYPKLAKHSSVLSAFGAATLAWLLVHRVKRLEKYHTPVVVGAGIAAIQTAVQAYMPKYAVLVSDHDVCPQLPAEPPKAPAPDIGPLPEATSGLPAPLFSSSSMGWSSRPTTAPSSNQDVSIDMDDDFDFGSLGSDDVDGDGLSDSDIDELLN